MVVEWVCCGKLTSSGQQDSVSVLPVLEAFSPLSVFPLAPDLPLSAPVLVLIEFSLIIIAFMLFVADCTSLLLLLLFPAFLQLPSLSTVLELPVLESLTAEVLSFLQVVSVVVVVVVSPMVVGMMVGWCCVKCRGAVSDMQVIHQTLEQK
jgi:hypothetical protein